MKIPLNELMEAILDDDNVGFCLNCGESQSGCEPDARGYKCESCGEPKVYGASEVLIMGEYRGDEEVETKKDYHPSHLRVHAEIQLTPEQLGAVAPLFEECSRVADFAKQKFESKRENMKLPGLMGQLFKRDNGTMSLFVIEPGTAWLVNCALRGGLKKWIKLITTPENSDAKTPDSASESAQ